MSIFLVLWNMNYSFRLAKALKKSNNIQKGT